MNKRVTHYFCEDFYLTYFSENTTSPCKDENILFFSVMDVMYRITGKDFTVCVTIFIFQGTIR